jgi:signal transduction histidine kinase
MDPLVRLARQPNRPPVSDFVAAGVILVWAMLEAVVATGPGSTPARIGFALVISLPLVFRRRASFAVITVIAVATVAWTVTADTPESGTMPFPALLLALFSVALYARTTATAVAGGLIAVAAMLIAIHTPFYDTEPTAGNTAILLFFSTGTWTAGWVVRRRAKQLQLAYEESGDLARTAVADERERIARELHDVVAHSVSLIAVQAGAAEAQLDNDLEAARDHLGAVRRTARDTMTEMRRLLGVLRQDDATYAPLPGLAGVPDLVDDARAAGTNVEYVETGEPRELTAGVDLVVYRVIQEALTNVRKHAEGVPARVTVNHGGRSIEVEVTNARPDGVVEPARNGGHGLIGMRERVRIFGGSFNAGPQDDGSFRVHALIPLPEDRA